MSDRVVVTIAARWWADLPPVSVARAVGADVLVELPEALVGMVRLMPNIAVRSAPAPDQWANVIQFVVESAGPFARDVFVGRSQRLADYLAVAAQATAHDDGRPARFHQRRGGPCL